MAASKRVRYEVLRRDGHKCRYCGATALDGPLTVDHVVPVALGGSDDPSNLVAACRPCNAGKTSTAPDAELVNDVEADALRWTTAIQRAAEMERRTRDEDRIFAAAFTKGVAAISDRHDDRVALTCIDHRSVGGLDGLLRTVLKFRSVGLDMEDLLHAAEKAMTTPKVTDDGMWRYFCGIAWGMVKDRQGTAKELLSAEGLPATSYACSCCGTPIDPADFEDDDEPPNPDHLRCEPCDGSVCNAYEAGRSHGYDEGLAAALQQMGASL